MITLIDTPGAAASSGNSIYFKASTDNAYTGSDVKGKILLQFAANILAGEQLVFTINDTAFDFDVVASPDDGGYEGGPITDFASFNLFIEKLGNNALLSKFFTFAYTYVSASNYSITLEQREADSTMVINCVPSTGDITETITAPENKVLRPNFKVIANIYRQNDPSLGRDYDFLFELGLSLDNLDQVAVNLASKLRSYLGLDMPSLANVSIFEQCANMYMHWRMELSENYGSLEKEYNILRHGVAGNYPLALYSKLDGSEFKDAYFGEAPVDFLTTRPKKTTIAPSQSIPLYFYLDIARTNIKVTVTIRYTDGTTSVVTIAEMSSTLDAQTIHKVNVGPTELDLDAVDVSKSMYAYDVQIRDTAGVVLTETLCFVVDRKPKLDEKFIFIPGELGALESVWLTGGWNETDNNSSVLNIKESDALSGLKESSSGSQNKFSTIDANTGLLAKDEMAWLRRMLPFSKAFTIENGAFVGYVMIDGTLEYPNELSNENVLVWQMRKDSEL